MSRRRLHLALVVIAALPAIARADDPLDARLSAATAIVDGKPEVRLRVRIENGWLPKEGIRIYRTLNGSRTRVYDSGGLSETSVEAVVPSFKGKGVWASASTPMAAPRALNFRVIRPPSAAARFREIKAVNDRLLQSAGSALGDAARRPTIQADIDKLADLKVKPVARLSAMRMAPLTSAFSAGDRQTFASRSKLTLASMVGASAAEKLGLGATDKTVKKDDHATYEVVVILPTRQDGPSLAKTEIVVGADDPPPAPTGIESQQIVDEDGDASGTIAIRWDRVDSLLEARLLNASYRVERRTGRASIGGTSLRTIEPSLKLVAPADTDWDPIHERPIMIAAINGDEEPVSFIDDSLQTPGTFTYRVALVDGFGRQSAWTEHVVTAVDWRRPSVPRDARGSLDTEVRDAKGALLGRAPGTRTVKMVGFDRPGIARPIDLSSWSANLRARRGTPSVSLSWIPVATPKGLTAKYRIQRIDTEAPNAPSVLLTPEPIDGTEVAPDDKAALQDSVRRLGLEMAALRALAATPVAQAAQKTLRVKEGMLREFQELLTPRRGFTDLTVRPDSRYRYVVRAIFMPSGLESDDALSGVVSVPSPEPPPAVAAIRFGGFSASEFLKRDQTLSDTVAMSNPGMFSLARVGMPRLAPRAGGFKPVSATAARSFTVSRRVPLRTAKTGTRATTSGSSTLLTKTLSPGALMRAPLFQPLQLVNLRANFLRGRDDGGTVALEWGAVPGLKDVTYHIQRRVKTTASSAKSSSDASSNPATGVQSAKTSGKIGSPAASLAPLTQPSVAFVDVGVTAPNQTKFRDAVPRTSARTYEYRVIAVSRWGVLGDSTGVVVVQTPSTMRPTQPNILAVAPDKQTNRAILVRVAPNVPDESVTRYRVYRGRDSIGTIPAGAGAAEELTYLDKGGAKGLTPGPYEYKVVAETAIGLLSDESRVLKANAVKLVAVPPSGVQAAVEPSGSVRITWNTPEDVASYAVQRSAGPRRQILVGTLDKALKQYLDVTAMRGTYVYEIVATDKYGNVSSGATATVTVP